MFIGNLSITDYVTNDVDNVTYKLGCKFHCKDGHTLLLNQCKLYYALGHT
jgi:hypothetical protein